jgi:hypothetical protein
MTASGSNPAENRFAEKILSEYCCTTFDVGDLLWMQANEVSLCQPAIPHEDRENGEQIGISELIDSIHRLRFSVRYDSTSQRSEGSLTFIIMRFASAMIAARLRSRA